MELIKSVRIRNRKNNLDIRVNLYQDKNKYILNGSNGKEGTTQMRFIWTNLQISTKGKYSNYTNDKLIKEFIDINSKRENTDYDIIQDPWSKNPPKFRNFGSDAYYLNNGSEVYISWSWLDGVTEINGINITNIEPGGLKWSDDKGNELKIPKSIENVDNSFKSYIRKKIKVKNSYRNTAGSLISEEFEIDKNGSLSKSEGKDYDGNIEDIDIINELISLWKIKVPNYESLRLCSPDNKVCYFSSGDNILEGIKYISPIDELQQTDSQDSQSVSEDPIADDKIKLSFQIDSTLNIKPREDFNFKIFIGEPPVDPLLAGFDFGDEEQDLSLLDDEFTEVEAVTINGEEIILFDDVELSRDKGSGVSGGSEGSVNVETGGSTVNTPNSTIGISITLPPDLKSVKNSEVILNQSISNGKRNINNDIIAPSGDTIKGVDIVRDMNTFVIDVLGPFASYLKSNYPNLYKDWYITSATRGYIPTGGSLTSQHLKGQAIDSQILGAKASNPGKNIDLLNAILEWYKLNPVGYGQILFETRTTKKKSGGFNDSCWIHWSYKRGNTRLYFARFKDDSTLGKATEGKYVLPIFTFDSLDLKNV